MKTHLIFYLLSLIFITPLPAEAVKKIEANPINVAATLVMSTDSAKVASTLEYYGYEPQPKENGYTVFRHPNGYVIRFTFAEDGIPQEYPTVQVFHKSSGADSRLKNLNFVKCGNHYETNTTKYSKYTTSCRHGSGNSLVFRRTKKTPSNLQK